MGHKAVLLAKEAWPYLGIGLICGCASIALSRWFYFPHSDVAAAWFQGFGTFAAVCMAISLAFRAERRAEAARSAERRRFMENIVVLCRTAETISETMRASLVEGDAQRLERCWKAAGELMLQFAKWEQLPIQLWPRPQLSVAVDSLGRHFLEVSKNAQALQAWVEDNGAVKEDVRKDFDRAVTLLCQQLEIVAGVAQLSETD